MPAVKLTLIADFKGASKEMHKSLKLTNEEFKELSKNAKKVDAKSLDDLVQKSKIMSASVRATKGPMAGLISQQRYLAQRIGATIRKGLDPMDKRLMSMREEYTAVTKKVNALAKEKKELADRTRELEKATKEQAKAAKEATETMADYAKYGLMAVATAAVLTFGAMTKASSGIEDAEAAFRPMLGTLQKSKAMVALINETAAKTPFRFEAISMSVKQLLPAVKGSMTGVIDTFRMLGDVSSGNARRLDSVTRAFTKSMLRGQVDMRSLNMIARAGVPIFSELSKSMGVTVKQLFEMSRKGQITSTSLVDAFKRMTSEGGMFFNGMQIAALTLSGRISTLQDNIMLLGANLGNILLPYAKELVEVLLDVAGALREFTKDTLASKFIVEGLAAAFSSLTIALVGFLAAAKGGAAIAAITLAFKGLAAAMMANPITAILVALAAAIPAIIAVGRNIFYIETQFAILDHRVSKRINTFIARVEEAFEKFSIKIGALLSTGIVNTVKTAASMAAKLLGEVLVKGAAALPYGFRQIAKSIGGMFGELSKKIDKTLLPSEDTDAKLKAVEGKYKRHVDNIVKHHDKAIKDLQSTLKDAKLATGGLSGGITDIATDQPAVGDRFMTAVDKKLKAEALVTKAAKEAAKERMEIHRIAKDKRIAFLNDEMARIRKTTAFKGRELQLVIMGIEDAITEIRSKGSKKRYKKAKKDQDDLFKLLLKGSVQDVTERRNLMEREAIESHYKERFKIMKVAKADEIAFIETEAERLSSFMKLTDQQRARAKEVADKMILERHKKHQKEMTKALAKETKERERLIMANAKKRAKEVQDSQKRQIKAIVTISQQSAAIMRSIAGATTDMLVTAAETGKYAFKDMVSSIMSDIMRLMANKLITDFLAGLFTRQQVKKSSATGLIGQVAGSIIPTMFGGGAIAKGTVPKNAKGAILTRPTLNMAGEAGPEAIIPLVRRGGVLGLAAPSGGGTTVNIINQAGVEVEEKTSRDAFGKERVDILIKSTVNTGIRRGDFDSAFQSIGLPARKGMRR